MSRRATIEITGAIPEGITMAGIAGSLGESVRFETEQARNPNGLGLMDRMMRPDHFLNLLESEAEQREDLMVADVSALNLKWNEAKDGSAAHFSISPDAKSFVKGSRIREWFESYGSMRVDYTGYRSACKQIERTPKTLNKFDNPAGRFMSELSDYYRRSSGRGIIVRTNNHGRPEKGRTVDAFCPGKMNMVSNFQLAMAIFSRINQVYGDCIRGVQTIRGDEPENLSYRILFGNPIAKEKNRDPRHMSFLMFSFMGSEHGLTQTDLDLGFWRMVCTNGAMRRDLNICHASWRRFDSEKKFLHRAGNLVNMAGVYGDCIGRKIHELEEMELAQSPHDILSALQVQRLMDKRTLETAELSLNSSVPETNWDFLNLLTDASKTHADMRRRSKAESTALMLSMQPRAFNGIVTDGFNKTASRGDFRAELGKFDVRNN